MKPRKNNMPPTELARVATLSTNGRLVIPKAIRDLLGVKPGGQLNIVLRDEHGSPFATLQTVSVNPQTSGTSSRSKRKP
jgi:AbrB family looped-hinge helix DNA binding protein